MIQVLNRAFDILEFVAREKDRKFTLAEIADNFGLNHGTCANIIKTMVLRGYIEKQGKRDGYRLGAKAYYLTGNFLFKKELLNASVGLMKELRLKLNEGIILAILQNNKRILLHEERSTHELQVVNLKEKDIYKTSTGRMILASMNKSDQHAFVEKFGLPDNESWEGVEDEEDFFSELKKIRKKRIAIHLAKSGIVGVAVPVYLKNKVVASLGVYLPKSRFNEEMQSSIFKELPLAADQINKRLDIVQSENNDK